MKKINVYLSGDAMSNLKYLEGFKLYTGDFYSKKMTFNELDEFLFDNKCYLDTNKRIMDNDSYFGEWGITGTLK